MTTFLFYYSLTLTIVVLYQNRGAVRRLYLLLREQSRNGWTKRNE